MTALYQSARRTAFIILRHQHIITPLPDIDKNFLFRGGSIGWLFWLVNGYFASILHRKAGAGDAIG